MVGEVSEVKRNEMPQRHYFRQSIFSLLSKKKKKRQTFPQVLGFCMICLTQSIENS